MTVRTALMRAPARLNGAAHTGLHGRLTAALLDRLAAEVAAWQAEVELLRGENERLKHALRTWQTEQAQASTGKRWPTNGPWPGR